MKPRKPIPIAHIEELPEAGVAVITWRVYPYPGGAQWETRNTLAAAIRRVEEVTEAKV